MGRRAPRIVIEGDVAEVRVTPRASAEDVALDPPETGAPPRLSVRVTAPPADGAANAAVIRALARALGVPRSALTIERGAASRVKRVRIRRG